ncbi:MAG: hypothetical protein FJZ01_23450 [Candidatus Sericytochromatia bacterium]|nr:hypothetical protein [Candidatus Tanganyikabacteria bacterium]
MRGLAQDFAFFLLFWLLAGPPAAAMGLIARCLPLPAWAHLGLAPVYVLGYIVMLIGMAGFVRSLIPRLVPGTYPFPVHPQSTAWLLHFALQRIMNLPVWSRLVFAFATLRWLWFRAMGARAAYDMQSAVDVVVTDPSLLRVGRGSMLAAGAFFTGHFIENGQLLLDTVEIGEGAQVHGQVTLAPGVRVGDGAVIGPGCKLLPGAAVGADSHLGLGCLLQGGTKVGDNVVLGHQVVLEAGVTVGDGAVVRSGARVPKGAAIAPGERFPPRPGSEP